MAALTSAVMMTGWVYSRPPLTMRWPTAAISDLSDTARAAPEVSASSKCVVASWRDAGCHLFFSGGPGRIADFERSALTVPFDFSFPQVVRAAISGKGSPRSYSDDFWLLEPELSTRIFTQ